MIFVTVGAQMPFDRMIHAIDQWASKNHRSDVFAQVGPTKNPPRHIQWTNFLKPDEFLAQIRSAHVIIAHAGMGSILTALELGKPILVMPRRGDLHETRNDHQIATAKQFLAQGRVQVAFDETELAAKLNQLDSLSASAPITHHASPALLQTLRSFAFPQIAPRQLSECDGVICFGGEDWWYHNRGHYDMQMIRHFSRHVPSLYINSIGMRVPRISEGRMFFKRLTRKIHSFRRGMQMVADRFAVFSPVSMPGLHGTWADKKLLATQVRHAARELGMQNPLLWIACPPAAELIDDLPHSALVYQRTDRYEAFPGVNQRHIAECDSLMKSSADLTLFCSSLLYNQEKIQCRRPLFLDHGVDYSHFATAGANRHDPADLHSIPHPRVGFVGSIDAHTFDPDLFLQITHALPDLHFVMVGGCSLPQDWCTLPNVHFLGQRRYDQVADYMAACDVLIMPWNRSDWIRACNPVKLKEYMAVGRPIVSTPFEELSRYNDFVAVASEAPQFADHIRQALQSPFDPAASRDKVAHETWSAKVQTLLHDLQQMGLTLAPQSSDEAVTTPAPVLSNVLAAAK